ncbi:LamB/YcsF family protein [Pseudalkalibacillus salsuginis]|uniref:LamB/YcsF family protein n=1 Tax=Pseudalkalibacillus salsuginis TaxID=2910972 RepID=UPI001F401552|nr:5-oxoprolinase subunit PxpA [Pseudalkalibacillus salsuginis]MCF6412027.1 LamB/YcsF family protein [Pseudalkalibacillus salsuginis]
MYKVDLNCDMGESYGLYEMGNDEEMMRYITSANIACGYHAGDPHTIRKTVMLAKEHGVQIGAHPGFPDLIGFGRRHMTATASEIRDYVLYQLGALREFAKLYDADIQHCKPHGALFMMAMEDEGIAKAILEGLAKVDPEIIVYALNNSAAVEAGRKMGIRVAKEVYSDREHTDTGSIVITRKGSTITDYDQMAERVVRMVKDGKVETHLNETADVKAETVCIHGDTPGAPKLAKAIRDALERNDVEITDVRNII